MRNHLGINQLDQRLGTEATTTAGGGGGSGNAVAVAVDFGASFTDSASAVVTGQAWVASDSTIVVGQPHDVDTDELRLLGFEPFVVDRVAGVGFTLVVKCEAEAKGTYTFPVLGV